MTFDLEAARALHDRSAHSYGCTTCTDGMGNPLDWPCATAVALGATGRSEWLDAPAPKPGPAVTYNITADALTVTKVPTFDLSMESTLTSEETTALVDHLTRTKESERCPWILRDGTQCDNSGPDCPHPVTQCTYTVMMGRRCQLGLGHNSPHDVEPELCGMGSRFDQLACVLEPGHDGDHRDRVGDTWGAEDEDLPEETAPEPAVCASTYRPAEGRAFPCVLVDGHASMHDSGTGVRWTTEGAEGVQPKSCTERGPVSGLQCKLPAGHSSPHDRDGGKWRTMS